MSSATRREFLKKSGCTVLTVGLSRPAFFRRVNQAAASALTEAVTLSPNDRILVVIQLDGGNDGLNTVIPLSRKLSGLYQDYRPQLAVHEDQVLPIGADAANNQIGLHPALEQIKLLYVQPKRPVAILQGVGYPNPNRSHFRSQAIWHTANLDRLKKTGWLGDYVDLSYPSADNPFLMVSIGGELPLTLRSNHGIASSIDELEDYQIHTGGVDDANNRTQAFLALNRIGATENVLYQHIHRTALSLSDSTEAAQSRAQNYVPDPSVMYEEANPLANALQQVARIIAADLGTRIFYVSFSGFDTHTNQAHDHARLLRIVSEAIDAFYRDIRRLHKEDRVLLMTWSEFGRKAKQNADVGTDHGASAPQFVCGSPVQGGIYGAHPSLTDVYVEDDLKHGIDFRSYYATILERWLDVDSQDILGGSFELLGFI
jgi:uncharacterized protein (DUF1501 family)